MDQSEDLENKFKEQLVSSEDNRRSLVQQDRERGKATLTILQLIYAELKKVNKHAART